MPRHLVGNPLPGVVALGWIGVFASGCAVDTPTGPVGLEPSPSIAPSWGPATPPFHIEVVLRDQSGGNAFGLVRFRQPKDADLIVNLDTWVRDLAPNTSYRLQRAVDAALDDVCSGASWLTLGQGLTPHAIVTDDRGTGRADLWRTLATPGNSFDIHFRVVIDGTTTVVLQSECYRFVVSQ